MNIGRKIKSLGIMMEAPYLFGLKLRGYPWEMVKELTRKLITDSQIKTVIDVGANVGQFATAIMNVLPDANVYSLDRELVVVFSPIFVHAVAPSFLKYIAIVCPLANFS